MQLSYPPLEGSVLRSAFVVLLGQVTAAEHPRVDYDSADSISSQDEDEDDEDEFTTVGTSRL